MQIIIYDYSPEYSSCGVLADFPDGEGLFFDSFEEFEAFVADDFSGAELVPLFAEGEYEYL
ncbi:hypothetical protein QF20_004065 [Salmonella enterica subsp. enterica]|uniref:Uncharacterized protein n=1 Tax=Salmonella enterica TaxID=28901 RepID=A0A759NPL5_SALER|nr:hypothetical protein [Salmonella enterica]EAC0380963.1 hypothetical protein [Salmonella enterica subsp. enterica serovar Potsdam]EBR0169318.1 hypothetical protein [Salmonella enterica subsp. enterica serovar Mikawasima]ECF2155495.1 hypothetical protein [Salmonella enterica subsp. enterica serovar Kottbus]ECF2559265.1 hypothetical protein [Salmonella enterica subsp. enterica serovar Ahuza]ECN5159750.1 hypothetical protein [Salmonella enterica subsp. enterica serovar Newport]ECY5421988.1 hyp